MTVFDNDKSPYVFEQDFNKYLDGYVFEKDSLIKYDDYQFDYGFTRFLFNRNFIIEKNIFFPNLMRYEDPVFLVKFLDAAQEFYALHKKVYAYRDNHKLTLMNKQIILDTLKGIKEVSKIAHKKNYNKLNEYTLERLQSHIMNYDFYLTIKYLRLYILISFYNKSICNYLIKRILHFIFSVNNSIDKTHKIITVLGLKIKFKRKQHG